MAKRVIDFIFKRQNAVKHSTAFRAFPSSARRSCDCCSAVVLETIHEILGDDLIENVNVSANKVAIVVVAVNVGTEVEVVIDIEGADGAGIEVVTEVGIEAMIEVVTEVAIVCSRSGIERDILTIFFSFRGGNTTRALVFVLSARIKTSRAYILILFVGR